MAISPATTLSTSHDT